MFNNSNCNSERVCFQSPVNFSNFNGSHSLFMGSNNFETRVPTNPLHMQNWSQHSNQDPIDFWNHRSSGVPHLNPNVPAFYSQVAASRTNEGYLTLQPSSISYPIQQESHSQEPEQVTSSYYNLPVPHKMSCSRYLSPLLQQSPVITSTTKLVHLTREDNADNLDSLSANQEDSATQIDDISLLQECTTTVKHRRHKGCTCRLCKNTNKCNEKQFHKCHMCEKGYRKSSHLKSHLLKHFNQRPYVCTLEQCSKAFTRSDELQRHKRTHTGERNYVCLVCDKRFGRSDHLSKHSKLHLKIIKI